MRHFPRLDATQKGIVEGLREAGYTVVSHAAIGRGHPDVMVGGHGRTVLLHIKSGRAKTHKREWEAQDKWDEQWRGGPVTTVFTLEEALKAVQW